MAELDPHEAELALAGKVEETRDRFKSELLQDSPDKYDSRDVDRLLKDDSMVDSYLTWRHFVVDDALKMIDESFQWRRELGLNDLTENSIPRWMFETGAVFLHGYDKEGNKLFWFKVKLHVKDAKTTVDKRKYVAFWLERYATREPGMQLTVVFDMAESGLGNIDMDFVKYIINCFKIYYPKFLSKMIIVDMPWIMNAAWKIVKTWLGPEAVSKLKFSSRSEVHTLIDPEYLPPHLGGTDPFKYSYPPLPDDDFLTPVQENGPIGSEEEEAESKEGQSEVKETLEASFNSDDSKKTKKVNFLEESLRSEDSDKGDSACRTRAALCCTLAQRRNSASVRTTAPEKYRVKPSSSSCDPGASVDIVVSLHGGYSASLQDRFLVMAAEMEGNGTPELTQFWKDVSKVNIMEHRLRCHVLESVKPALISLLGEGPVETSANGHPDVNTTLMRMMACNARLEQKLDSCLWGQKVLLALLVALVALTVQCLYLVGS
ncbi:hypothetical protein NHX12_007532 [Muraenolepis orangiensis]|uniref:Motile sperm domain-containing protein 2 n=1 Tax=Muraenolepis orangiensis TaxID=630683 RepID=A0A9Q0IBM9_9TELE|nr:hypothetical protein NHX12_007532 [Muraenolepis orangiensis]